MNKHSAPIPNDLKSAARGLFFLNPRRRYHRAEILFEDKIPQKGGAIIVSNHGRLDLDAFILAGLILRSRQRMVHLMADHLWFRQPVTGRMMARAGAVDGTRDNALHLLAQGELVLTYPGGVREIMRSRFGQERLHWQGRTGFAKVALSAGVPIIPVAGFGVNDGFLFVSSGRRLGKLLYRTILGLGPAYASYRDPLAIGLLPIPLPFSMAVHFPMPCKVRYVVGEPIYPAGNPHNPEETLTVDELAQKAADALRQMLRRKKNHLPIQPKRNSLRKVSP